MAQFPPMIAPAVGYRVEGVADGRSAVIKCPVEGLLNGVFNLEGDNDMRYYQDNFMSKRMYFRSSPNSSHVHHPIHTPSQHT
jgi:hypothetical protein